MNCYRFEPFSEQSQLQSYVKHCDLALEKRMERIAKDISESKDLHLVGLTGPTCSGKTTAANKLTDYLKAHNRSLHVISIDDFYYDKAFLQKRADDDPDIEIDYDSEDTIDIELLAEKTASLLKGQRTQLPRFDFKSGMRIDGEIIDPDPDGVFLYEGIQILYPKVRAILSQATYRCIYICPSSSIQIGDELFEPNELRLMRRLVRDFRYRGADPSFTFYLWQSVRENEEKSIFPYAHLCDDRIDSTMPYEVGMLKPYLEEILSTLSSSCPFFDKAQTILKSIREVQPVPSDYMTSNSLYKEFI